MPEPEYIRIQTSLIPPSVIAFYSLAKYINRGALYCSVHKTHYGLPQAGALSQQRPFAHFNEHGYTRLPPTTSYFRNKDGSIRFSLVVDDFAISTTLLKH
jgi:hypothetical protein